MIVIKKYGYNLGIIGEGELFGKVSSLFNKGHSVSAEAATECRLLIIEKDLFYNKVQNADPILKAVIRTLTGRLDDMNEKLKCIKGVLLKWRVSEKERGVLAIS